jgi:L-gulonolactone oxidase
VFSASALNRFVEDANVLSWGRVLRGVHRVARPRFVDEIPELVAQAQTSGRGLLAIGLRRSYGDSGLNPDGAVLDMSALDRLSCFDERTRVLTAEAGISLGRILEFAVPRGFFLPVTPGTRFVTLGGAVANDVHGKNHHRAGTLGRWVRQIRLVRSDGTNHVLNPSDRGLFAATIGGLGMTGVITHVALELKPISSTLVDAEILKFGDLSEYFSIAEESADNYEYTVAWVDVMARGKAVGRGLFSRANHTCKSGLEIKHGRQRPMLSMPIEAPGIVLNRLSVAAFNSLYFKLTRGGRSLTSGSSFFYPLDRIANWNKLYGKRGMYQYQCVIPKHDARDATAAMLHQISESGQGSFLAVLKPFGRLPSPGLLSFPMEGTTFALDFPNRGKETLVLLDKLDAIVRQAGGRLYPAKDGRVPRDLFFSGYPALETFDGYVDSGMSSSFWRRMHQ